MVLVMYLLYLAPKLVDHRNFSAWLAIESRPFVKSLHYDTDSPGTWKVRLCMQNILEFVLCSPEDTWAGLGRGLASTNEIYMSCAKVMFRHRINSHSSLFLTLPERSYLFGDGSQQTILFSSIQTTRGECKTSTTLRGGFSLFSNQYSSWTVLSFNYVIASSCHRCELDYTEDALAFHQRIIWCTLTPTPPVARRFSMSAWVSVCCEWNVVCLIS